MRPLISGVNQGTDLPRTHCVTTGACLSAAVRNISLKENHASSGVCCWDDSVYDSCYLRAEHSVDARAVLNKNEANASQKRFASSTI